MASGPAPRAGLDRDVIREVKEQHRDRPVRLRVLLLLLLRGLFEPLRRRLLACTATMT